jgi:hypothetical protein
MKYSKLSLHGITKIEIEDPQSAEDVNWRYVVFTDEDGDEFTIAAFPSKKNVEAIPVSFVRDLGKTGD